MTLSRQILINSIVKEAETMGEARGVVPPPYYAFWLKVSVPNVLSTFIVGLISIVGMVSVGIET